MDRRAEFLVYLGQERLFSEHTVLAYDSDLCFFEDFLQQQACSIDATTPEQIRAWIFNRLECGDATRSVLRRLSTLRSYFHFLQKNAYRSDNPMERVIPPKSSKPLPVFCSEQEMKTLFDVVTFSDDFSGKRDKMVLELFYATGMRSSELVHLTISSIDYYNNTIKVLGKGNKERLVPMPNQLAKWMQEYITLLTQTFGTKSCFDALFLTDKGEPIYPMMVYRIVKKYLNQVSSVSKKSPHIIRHTFATHMLNNGADLSAIKSILGHSSLSATQVYTHTSIEQLKKTYNQAHPRA